MKGKREKGSKSHRLSKRPVAKLAIRSPAEPPKDHFPIVGIGASAGGLEAFSQLLKAIPESPGLAIVFVQHMAPLHESMLASLLTPTTRLAVRQIAEDTQIEPNHVYVIPPNRNMVLQGRTLRLQPRPVDRTQYTPVDTFLQSLAKELGAEAIGVILSGTASDGVEGVHAIKAAGGIVLVQDPETAKYDGMPRAALATGKVDLVLSPVDIAHEIAYLAECHPRRLMEPTQFSETALDSQHLDRIFSLLRAASGVDFNQYKLPTIQRRIGRRIALNKLTTVEQYLKLLLGSPAEVTQLYQDLLIHVTRFFRDPDSFRALAEDIFPRILQNRQGDAPIRIWVPACSTGEEPCSVAITLMECLDGRGEQVPIQIFATDISEAAIDQARAGVFPPSISEDMSPERLRRFFSPSDGNFRVNKSIRDLCVFARQDLTRDPPFSKLDLIVCRNVLIYLGQPVQSRLIHVFHYALKGSGHLMLGSAETIGAHTDLFAVSDKKNRVYAKKAVDMAADVHFTAPYSRTAARPQRPGEDALGMGNAQNEANRLVLERYAPPGVIVNEDLRIVQFRGHTGRFLEPAPGDASLNLLKMCREGLLHGLRTAIQGAKKKDGPARREGLRVKVNGHFIDVSVEVVPLTPSGEGRHYLILFQDLTKSSPPVLKVRTGPKSPKSKSRVNDEEVDRLQKELIASREYLQSIIQDLEAANEELQSANEEILSSNEELQSTNEELDTAKEELQSTNEELNTVNDELHGRNEELARSNSDLINLVNGVQIAIVIVASDLRIRRFTPMAERVLNLISGDIGRPISQIKPNINCPDLEQLIVEVIDTISVKQRDVVDVQGRTLSLTIRPYKNVDNRIDGALLALFDTDEVRRHETQAQAAMEYCESVLDSLPEAIVVLEEGGRVRSVNASFCQRFGVGKEETHGRLLSELDGDCFSAAPLEAALKNPASASVRTFTCELKVDGGTSSFDALVRRVDAGDHHPPLLLLRLQESDQNAH